MRSRTLARRLHQHSKICSLARESDGKRILTSEIFKVPASDLIFNIYLIIDFMSHSWRYEKTNQNVKNLRKAFLYIFTVKKKIFTMFLTINYIKYNFNSRCTLSFRFKWFLKKIKNFKFFKSLSKGAKTRLQKNVFILDEPPNRDQEFLISERLKFTHISPLSIKDDNWKLSYIWIIIIITMISKKNPNWLCITFRGSIWTKDFNARWQAVFSFCFLIVEILFASKFLVFLYHRTNSLNIFTKTFLGRSTDETSSFVFGLRRIFLPL